MSDEIDLNVNNLSTTEEAFEVFQTNSMYIEDECLTLPVRECPQPAAEDAASVQSDMSIENDIVSSTNIEDQSQQASYCNLDVGSEVNISQDEPDGGNRTSELENEANLDPSRSQEMDYSQEQSSEVIKDVDSGGNIDVGQEVELETVSSSEVYNSSDLSPSKRGKGRPRGRGRAFARKGRGKGRGRGRTCGSSKKGSSDINSSVTNSDNDVFSDSCAMSSQPDLHNALESSNNNTDLTQAENNGTNGTITSPTQSMDTSTEEIPVFKRRGRKKKLTSATDNPPIQESTSPRVTRKRGRPRKDSTLNIILENPVPINGEASITNHSEMKDMREVVGNLVKIEDTMSKVEENLLDVEKIDEDDDDICLSKLKTTIDFENNISEVHDPILKELEEIPSSPLADVGLRDGDDENAVLSQQMSQDEAMEECEEIRESDVKVEGAENVPVEGTENVPVEGTENIPIEEGVENTSIDAKESLLVEDVSKRPKRSNAKKTLKYRNDDDSDEDPFANVELSDDDEPRRKKSGRYQSDEEYIPGRKGRSSSIDSSDSAVGDTLEELKIRTKKKGKKKKDIGFEMTKATKMDIVEEKQEPWRFSPNAATEDLSNDNDVGIVEPSVSNETKPSLVNPAANSWGTTTEFENFLAKKIQGTNLKIKKVKSSNSMPSVVAPLEIPVIDQNEVNKKVECSTQTVRDQTVNASSQTSGPSTLSMKTNVPLNDKQSENACNFLKSIVKTTSELGQLMTQKSDDFIQKKINTANVVDTFKMDYCVKKSFLLLKLAKHNIMQMEEDLTNQYDKFLQENELLSYREQEKKLEPKPKKADSDSDCEIIEEPLSTPKALTIKKESKPKFNPKTVFLNKELSIKIAKKPTEEVKTKKNIDIKGRHTVWINDSIMVKKVKGSQSFLAQDSRNKKPPDNKITEKMVSDFFADYNRQKAIFACAPFITTEWFVWRPKAFVCKYFSVEPDILTSGNISRTEEIFTENENNGTVSDSDNGISEKIQCEVSKFKNPTTLLTICLNILQKHVYMAESSGVNITPIPEYANKTSAVKTYEPKTLFTSCFDHLIKNQQNVIPTSEANDSDVPSRIIPSLKTMCHSRMIELYFVNKTTVKNVDKLKSVASISVDKAITEETVSESDDSEYDSNSEHELEDISGNTVKPLVKLCIQVIQECQKPCQLNRLRSDSCFKVNEDHLLFSCPNSLKHISFECVKKLLKVFNSKLDMIVTPNIAVCNKVPSKVKKLADICFDIVSTLYETDDSRNGESSEAMPIELTINAVNTLSEEAFLNIEETSANDQDHSDYYEDDGGNFYEDESIEPDYNENEVADNRENESWVSQVQLKEFKPCLVSDKAKQNTKPAPDNDNEDTITESYPLIANIKTEPGLEEPPVACDPFAANIKTEPDQYVDQMTIIPESIVTKSETIDNVDPLPVGREPIVRQNSSSFDEENFEAFVRSNKMIKAMDNYEDENEETFSQSALRVRRQHEPDSDNENDTSMSLLVPQTFEPLTIESAKGSLLENSSSDSEGVGKKNCKRKPISRRKTKKTEPPKPSKDTPAKENKEVPLKENKETPTKGNKEVPSKDNKLAKENKEIMSKDKPFALNEVAVLTRRMRERIRQEEKKAESSESESEHAPPAPIPEKESKRETRRSRLAAKNNKHVDNEIQCNNVDSTEQVIDTNSNKSKVECGLNTKEDNKFTGFSAVDQNEISTYHKYVKYVYDQILPKVNEEAAAQKTESLPKDTIEPENDKSKETGDVIHPDEPIELLECTPTMPMFDDDEDVVKPKRKSARAEAKTLAKTEIKSPAKADIKSPAKAEIKSPANAEIKSPAKAEINTPAKAEINTPAKAEINIPAKKAEESHQQNIEKNVEDELMGKEEEKGELFTERNGWKCYPIQAGDTKLYEQVIIPLEKLPESFVQTYFEYQEISAKSKEDEEIDRLTNLQSLNRSTSIVKKPRPRKDKGTTDENSRSIQDDGERPETPADTDNYNELSPSEDEGVNYDDDYLTPVPDAAENRMAKNSLMNDDEDDDLPLSERKIKKDPDGEITITKKKPGPKSKTVGIKQENPESLMLTADKMMNKELTLLHAPVVLDNDNVQTPVKGPVTRNKPRSGTKYYGRGDRAKSDDSSSEEEKQWVNTKEKLLKRLGKRQETAMDDDAKRAKLVSEFIERRNDKPLILNHKPRGRPTRRSRKKMLERQKQMRVLSYELLGESGPHIGKASSAAYFKGRRNIRKVIDKKSLARSTVIANMEEFERKRRLSMKQKRLEELLGCEEGVNVIVTNDEVCLEYDFEVGQPAVTVHPFFTKVMKAHQYEGVKFMWDACFESVEMVQSGHPGGGCILAHCMGLGKTLQVLALLHTVLTHPRVGMQRVLVCCPLSTVLNWVDEIHKWIGPVTDEIKVFELSKLKKTYERAYQLEDWYNGGGIFIVGYELFRSLTTLDAELDDVRQTIIDKIRTALLDPGPDIIVCDEGHLLKNDASVLAVAMSRVATRRRIVLTGTPMQNNLREYYCMVNFVKPNLLGTYAEYSNRFENPIMNGQHRDSQVEDIKLMKARTHILHKVLEGCLQRQEASVLYPYLPKKHEYTVFISLTKCQCELYKHYLNVYANKNKQSILKDFHTLQKIWSHPQVLHNFNMKAQDEKNRVKTEKMEDDLAREDLTASEDIKPTSTEVWWLQHLEGGNMLEKLESSNKFMAVFRILKESVALDDKVLIFSTSLITMDSLEYFLKKINNWSLGQEYYRLDGSVPPEVRQKWCREFNAEHNYKTKLFLISTRAGSLGLNMTAANRVIILDTSWNPAHDIQSIFRVYRFGQKKDCYIYRLVALGTMEQKIYERAVTKQAVSCRVVDEQQIDRHYNMAELTELYRFDETGSGVAGGVAVGVQDVVLLRVARDSALHAVHEHDSLLRGSEPALPEHERAAAWHQFQQEQHNQLQPDKVPKKEKKVNKRSLSLDKTATLPTPEVKEEPSVDDNIATPPEPKSKRGRKIINCRIPIQASLPEPSTSSQPDYYVDKNEETDMVTKISQILVSHEFNNRRAGRDLSKLITTVQQAVASGDLSQLPPGDEAAAKIAQILLRKGQTAPSAPLMPALTDIRNPIDQRTMKTQEQIVNANVETITGDLNFKARRRAAVTAQKKFDAIADDIVIDLNDDDWQNDDDYSFAPTRNPEPVPEPVPEVKRELSRPVNKYKPGPKSKKNPSQTPEKPPEAPVTQQLVESIQQSLDEESILLSDDEIVPEVRAPPVTIKQEPDTSRAKYPLHASLLTNQNFIKIVAHTYLAGNPMLDEDAATLAARYSTSKALREMEDTGKSIDSGPIYDIAVKVLGMDILKKLHSSGPTDTPTTKTQQKAFSDTERMLSDAAPEEQKPLGRLKAKVTSELMPTERKPKIANLGLVKLTPVTPVLAAPVLVPPGLVPPVVVPVGLIKRAGPPGGADAEECILPDDDDVHVLDTTPPPPAAAPPPPAPHRAPLPQFVLNSVVAGTSALPPDPRSHGKLPAPANIPTIKVVGNRIIAVGPDPPAPAPTQTRGKRAPQAPAPRATAPTQSEATICLDSDEEEPPAPPPVPVTLTAATSGMRLELQMPNETPLRTQPEPKTNNVKPPPANLKPTQPPPAKRAPIVREPPRPAPEAKPESKAKSSTVCKPGDIIRITKSGQVEVLNKCDSVPDLTSRKSRPGPSSRKPTPAPETVTSMEQDTPKPVESPVRVSTSSASSRSPSPEDPLSILKDVVQIPADRYQSILEGTPSKQPPEAPKSAPPKPAPPKPAPKKPENKPSSLFDKLNMLKAKQLSKTTTSSTANSQAKVKKQTNVNKGPSIVVDSVDLTDLPIPAPQTKPDKVKTSTYTNKSITPGKTGKIEPVATVVGTSKNIILSGLGKTNKVTVGSAPASSSKGSSVRVTNMETLSPATFKRIDKKRPAIKQEPGAPKRKKTEPMTLKDFNLDDIDDIIELE